MPRDADYGRELATKLTSLFTGRIDSVEFTYDSYLELDQLAEGKSYCVIAPLVYENTREGRSIWRESIQLSMTMVSVVGANSEPQWIDDWLDSWDSLVRNMRETILFNNRKPVSVDTDERYDAALFHSHRRLVTQASINYGNVEVI